MTIEIVRSKLDGATGKWADSGVGKVTLCDLAGSERYVPPPVTPSDHELPVTELVLMRVPYSDRSMSGSHMRAQEGHAINSSLTELKRCIAAMAKKQHVPWRWAGAASAF